MTLRDKIRLTELEFDLRVRDRLLAGGTLSAAAIEGHLASLPDLEDRAEAIPIEQPALGIGAVGYRADSASASDGAE